MRMPNLLICLSFIRAKSSLVLVGAAGIRAIIVQIMDNFVLCRMHFKFSLGISFDSWIIGPGSVRSRGQNKGIIAGICHLILPWFRLATSFRWGLGKGGKGFKTLLRPTEKDRERETGTGEDTYSDALGSRRRICVFSPFSCLRTHLARVYLVPDVIELPLAGTGRASPSLG